MKTQRFSLVLALFAAAACSGCARAEAPPLAPTAQAPLKQVATIPLDGVEGRIDHMALDAKTQRLFLAALGNNTVEVLDLASGKRLHTLKGFEEPQGIVVVPDSQRVLIASGQDGKCRIYDASLKLLSEIDGLDDADNVRYDAAKQQVIVGYGSGALAIIDPQTGSKIAEIKLDAHPESFQLENNGNRLFVNVPGAAQIAVIDRDKRSVIAKWTLPAARSNFPMALDEKHHRLFVGCRQPALLVVLDTATGKSLATLPIVGDTDDLFYDPAAQQIYASGGAGRITIISQKNPDTYRLVDEFNTAPGARTSFLAPDSRMLYLAVPHRGTQAAELRAFQLPALP